MRLFVYHMLVNVNVIYYVQARWACSAGNSAIENLCIIIINKYLKQISVSALNICGTDQNQRMEAT